MFYHTTFQGSFLRSQQMEMNYTMGTEHADTPAVVSRLYGMWVVS